MYTNWLNYYVSGAEPYKDSENPVETAAENHVPDFSYLSPIAGTPTFSAPVRNATKNDMTESFSIGTDTNQTYTTTIENSESYDFGQMIGSETKFDDSLKGITDGVEETLKIELSFGQAFGKSESAEESKSTTIQGSVEQQITIPAHTSATPTQQISQGDMSLAFDTPVALVFKVAVFSMSGDVYADGGCVFDMDAAQYETSNFSCFFGGDTNETGFFAYESLYNKDLNKNTPGWNETYGQNHFYNNVHDGKDNTLDTTEKALSWTNIGTYLSKNYGLNTNTLSTTVPMLSTGATAAVDSTSIKSDVTNPEPLYLPKQFSLDSTQRYYILYSPSASYNMSSIEKYITCTDKDDVNYYDYIGSHGHWEVSPGSEDILEYDESSNSVKAKQAGTGSVQWVLNDDVVYTATEELGTVTSKDLAPLKISFHVLGENKNTVSTTNYSVRCISSEGSTTPEFEGTVGDDSVDPSTLFEVVDNEGNPIHNTDQEGNPVGLSYSLEFENADDSTKLQWETDNTVKFLTTDSLKVRAKIYDPDSGEAGGTLYTTDWLTVTPRAARVPSSAQLTKTDFPKKTLVIKYLLNKTTTEAAHYDLSSFVTYYDQYGDKWENKDNLTFTLDQTEGYTWKEKILSFLKEGKFTVTVSDDRLPDKTIGTMNFEFDVDYQIAVSGIQDGGAYCKSVTGTLNETFLDRIEVNGNKITVTDGKFTLTGSDEPQKIVVYGKNGKVCKEMTVTVHPEHTYVWGEWVKQEDGTETRTAVCSCNESLSVTGISVSTIKGLEEEIIATGKSLTLVVDVNSENLDHEAVEEMEKLPDDKQGILFMDIAVQDTGLYTRISETANILEIPVQVDLKEKDPVSLYRYHDDKLEAFEQLTSRPTADFKDRTYYPDYENNILYVYSNQFSTYGLIYTEAKNEGAGTTSTSGDNTTTTATETTQQPDTNTSETTEQSGTSTTGTASNTGDDSLSPVYWILLMLLCFVICMTVIIKRHDIKE